jgi:surfactin synthase thioesterase subunit
MMTINEKAWIVRRPQSRAAVRLFCFPYAGGGASVYSGWQEALGPLVEVCSIQAPGRGSRASEPAIRDLSTWISNLAPALVELSGLPFAFFGHSLGALAAFEMTRYLVYRALPLPRLLVVSGAAAPSERDGKGQKHLLPDAEFLRYLEKMGGTPPAIMGDPDLMAYLLPMIRADLEMFDTYAYRTSLRLPVPIVAFAGATDSDVEPESMRRWSNETRSDFGIHVFEGGHFFLHSQSATVIRRVAEELDRRSN